jgi:hypothetical protein
MPNAGEKMMLSEPAKMSRFNQYNSRHNWCSAFLSTCHLVKPSEWGQNWVKVWAL